MVKALDNRFYVKFMQLEITRTALYLVFKETWEKRDYNALHEKH